MSSRHERWRAQFDVLYKDSVTTNHACHDFEVKNKDVTFYAPKMNAKKIEGFVVHTKDTNSNGFYNFSETNLKKHTDNKFLPELFNNTFVTNGGDELITLKNSNCFYFLFSDNKTISSNHLTSRKPRASWPFR